jgi:large subunit ribosomal protein L19
MKGGKKAEALKAFKKPKGEPDDLKLIAGVTPEIETKLNKLGVIKFEQIANFSDEEIAYVDEQLALDGAVERDDWVYKAVALMAETTAEEVPAGEDELEAEEASGEDTEAPKAKADKAPREKAAKKPKKG